MRRRTFFSLLSCAITITAASTTWATAAHASTFDAASGKLTLDAKFSSGLDAVPGGIVVTATDHTGLPVAAKDVAARFVADANALEGTGAFYAGGAVHTTEINLASLAPTFGTRRVNVRVWQRPGSPVSDAAKKKSGTVADLFLVWSSGPLEPGITRFNATGRGTDDGWREYESGPVDFSFGGTISPSILVRDSQLVGSTLDPLAPFPVAGIDYDADARVALDALEIVDLGAALAPQASCSVANAATACGAGTVCTFNRCVDAAASIGSVPQTASLRQAFIDRVRFDYRTFEGGRYGQSQMSTVDAALSAAASLTEPTAFWAALQKIDALRDAHSQPPSPYLTIGLDTGMCLGLGAADLLPANGGNSSAADPVYMVYQANSGGGGVQPGDVLQSIDGMAVDAWIQLQKRMFFVPGDPRAAAVYTALLLPNAMSAAGAKLTFARCDRAGHSKTQCAANEVTTVTVDLGALAAQKVWSGSVTAADMTPTQCDPRFSHVVPDAGATSSYDYVFAGSVDLDASTRLLQINGVPAEQEEGGEAWKTAVSSAVATSRANFILDEREGNGGSPDPAFPLLFGSFFSAAVPVRAELIPFLEGQPLEPALTAGRACVAGEGAAAFSGMCDSYSSFVYDGTASTFTKDNSSAKLAILGGMDVSGNDYLTRMMLTRTGTTRFFSAVPTMGGYGEIFFVPGYGVASYGGSMQIQDTIFTTSNTDPNRTFESASGVVPDEVVLEKQSDAINGIDTIITRARAWLAAGQ